MNYKEELNSIITVLELDGYNFTEEEKEVIDAYAWNVANHNLLLEEVRSFVENSHHEESYKVAENDEELVNDYMEENFKDFNDLHAGMIDTEHMANELMLMNHYYIKHTDDAIYSIVC